jgi:hypothetical protein
MRRFPLCTVLVCLLAGPADAGALPEAGPLTAAGPGGSAFTLSASNRLRGELADWFDAGGGASNSDYAFLGNRTQVGLLAKWRGLSGFLQYQHTVLSDVPQHAPGVGGTYRTNTASDVQEGGWLRQGWLQGTATSGDWRLTTQGGRMRYQDGLESVSPDPVLEWLRKNRIGERLLGPFDYTHVGRSFDGGRVAAETPAFLLSGFYFLPTSGGFEISAGRHMGIDLGGLSVMKKDDPHFVPGLEARLFWIHYRDHRPDDGDVVVLDNRPLAERQADRRGIEVETIGGELVYTRALGPGAVEGLVWSAGQVGEWQSLDQRGWAWAVEGGYRLTRVPWTPWLRAGVFRSSGDDDPADGDHDTFFQLLPTARIYAQTPFYDLMNNQDVMAQIILRPAAGLTTRMDVHWLGVTEGRDLLYFGAGATKRDFFGYGGTPAGGSHETATVLEASASYTVSRNLDVAAYCGHAFGHAVVRHGFPRDTDLTYGYVEGTLAF